MERYKLERNGKIEIKKLLLSQQRIQNLDEAYLAKRRTEGTAWEMELGWLDLYFEILMIKGDLKPNEFRRLQKES
jgi:hypothetical protein